MKRCPNCGGTKFFVNAHVVQEWLMDGDEFLETTDTCVEIAHWPDNDDVWTCANCGKDNSTDEYAFEI